MPIIIGPINFPKERPNLNHSLLNGNKIFDFAKPKIKKTNEIINDQINIFPPFNKG